MEKKWVQIWGQAHSHLSHFYYPEEEKTFRFILNSALNGDMLRLTLSNEFGEEDIHIDAITVAKSDENGTVSGDFSDVTFGGLKKIVLKKGEMLTSDAILTNISIGEYISVSIFVKKGALKSGNLLNNIKLLTVKGDVTRERVIENQKRKRDTVIKVAGKILNLFLHKPLPLIESVEVLNSSGASSITVFGDSLCQQGFWTNRFEKRIREAFPGKYSVINRSVMGNRVLHDFSPRFPCRGLFGPSGMKRLERDVLSHPDTQYVIFTLGTNDFLQPGTIAAGKEDTVKAEDVFDAVSAVSQKLDNVGKKLIVFNLPMFGECIDSRAHKIKNAKRYNELLENNKDKFFCVYDQMNKVINPEKPDCTHKKYLGKDFLHYNTEGGNIVADGIDLELFR